jgi:hypothetical protein
MDPFFEFLPLTDMESDIKDFGDPFQKSLYQTFLETLENIHSPRDRDYFYKYGICALYSLFDPIYADPLKYLLKKQGLQDLDVKTPKNWRTNRND